MADTVDVILLRADAVSIQAWIKQISTPKYKTQKTILMSALDTALKAPSGPSDPIPVVFQPKQRT